MARQNLTPSPTLSPNGYSPYNGPLDETGDKNRMVKKNGKGGSTSSTIALNKKARHEYS